MQIALLVEDRDLAYCFFDIMNAPSGSLLCTLTTEGVDFTDLGDENKAVWLQHEGRGAIHVVPYGTVDFQSADFDEIGFPIPVPELVLDRAEYERRIADDE